MKPLTLLVLLAAGTGCSAQIGGGYATRTPDAIPRVFRVAGQLEPGRESGATVHSRMTLEGSKEDDSVLVRNGVVGAGLQVRPGKPPPLGFGWEIAAELGLGEPSFEDYDSLGAYVGLKSGVTYRVCGDADLDLNSYYTLALLVDVVVEGTVGVWSAPAGTEEDPAQGEAAGQLALRFTFLSDFARAARRRKSPKPPARHTPLPDPAATPPTANGARPEGRPQ